MNLQLVKSDKFGETECDIYSDSKEMYMTIDQIATCLEYSNGRKGIENVIARNEYLKNEEFSVTLKLRAKKAVFGCGWLVSEQVRAEREKAERWHLSERELEIIARISNE